MGVEHPWLRLQRVPRAILTEGGTRRMRERSAGKVPPPTERRWWAGIVEMTTGRFRVTLVRDTATITPEGEQGCE